MSDRLSSTGWCALLAALLISQVCQTLVEASDVGSSLGSMIKESPRQRVSITPRKRQTVGSIRSSGGSSSKNLLPVEKHSSREPKLYSLFPEQPGDLARQKSVEKNPRKEDAHLAASDWLSLSTSSKPKNGSAHRRPKRMMRSNNGSTAQRVPGRNAERTKQ